VAGITVARFGEHNWQRANRRTNGQAGRTQEERVLPTAVGGGGTCIVIFGEFWFMFFVGRCHSGGHAIGCEGDGIMFTT
jgi:hypothetical protein